MTNGPDKGAGIAIGLVLGLTLLISIEALSLFYFWRSNEELHEVVDQIESANNQTEKYASALKEAAPRIAGMYARLNDSIVQTSSGDAELPIPGQKSRVQEQPKPVRAWQAYGFLVAPAQQDKKESSVSFQIASDDLEFHRVVPALVEQENSNAFLFVDRLVLTRPTETGPFAISPTPIKTRMVIRILTAPR